MIAVGIGLHNFAEGLAIGQAAAKSEIALATLLVIGFALHNATEGFGIVAPLAGEVTEDGQRALPSWGFLLAMGAIGGGPTFIGTAVGHAFTSEALSVVFLSLAAGSILYVVIQLTGVAAKNRRMDLFAYGLLIGHHPRVPHRRDRHRRGRLTTRPMVQERMSLRRNHTTAIAPKTTRYTSCDDDADDHVVRVSVVGEHRLPRVEVVRREEVADATELDDAVEDLRHDVDADRRADRTGRGVGEGREERAQREQRVKPNAT